MNGLSDDPSPKIEGDGAYKYNSISGESDKSPSHLFILPIFSLGHFSFSSFDGVGTALICAVLPLHLAPQYNKYTMSRLFSTSARALLRFTGFDRSKLSENWQSAVGKFTGPGGGAEVVC